jgi:hypothetical protein
MPLQNHQMDTHSNSPAWRGYAFTAVVLLCWVTWANSGPAQWLDNGMFLLRATANPLLTDDLTSAGHPFFNLMSVLAFRLFGVWGVAYLNTALTLGMTGLVYLLARLLGQSRGLALASVCASLCVHSVLWVATKIEVYMLHLLLMLGCACLYVWLPKLTGTMRAACLVSIGVLIGLGASTHQLTFVVLAPVALQLLWQERLHFGWVALGGLLGLWPCWPGFESQLSQGVSAVDAVRGFLTGHAPQTKHEGWEGQFLRLDRLLSKPHLVATVLLSLFGVGALGLITRPQGRVQWGLWLAAWFNFVFAVSYDVPDRFSFFLPGAVLFAVLGVQSVARSAWPWPRVAHLWPLMMGTLLVYHLVPLAANERLLSLARTPNPAPGLNPLTYYMVPLKRDRSAEHFAAEVDQSTTLGSVVYAGDLTLSALQSAQKMGMLTGRELRHCQDFTPDVPQRQAAYLVDLAGCEALRPHLAQPVGLGHLLR